MCIHLQSNRGSGDARAKPAFADPSAWLPPLCLALVFAALDNCSYRRKGEGEDALQLPALIELRLLQLP